MKSETILHQRSIAAMPAPQVEHVHSLGPVRVAVPPLPTGGHFFDLWPVREWPAPGLWAASAYESFAPPVFLLHDVIVHSSAGILAIGGAVIAESLANTVPDRHRYRPLAKGIALRASEIERLPGAHISILAGATQDYRHSMLDSLARLIAVPDNYLAASSGLLAPRGARAQQEALGAYDVLPSLKLREIGDDETLRVETLVYPLSVCGEAAFHPCLADFFARLSANVAPSPARLPRRVYVDRRGNPTCPLRNEPELIDALGRTGFVPVRLEALSLPDQIRLFRQAEAIVAPHGAGLTNLGFARPGCLVVELLMDSHVDWSFRHLAALTGLSYDCVLGRARRPWPALTAGLSDISWEISVNHVVAAIGHSLPRAARAA
jgi:hypothetical protein